MKKYPDAKFYRDFRKMFDEIGKSIDAVTVSTPDHFHAIAASAAMRLGKHVYCQKPLTQTIYEARYLRDLAHRNRRRHADGQSGQRGGRPAPGGGMHSGRASSARCSEVHIWTNRPIWPQGMGRPEGSDPVPATLDWDIWIGPAPMRPYKKGVYHPFNWRGWQDFGTGALGDMACHTVNMPFRALQPGLSDGDRGHRLGAHEQGSYPLGSKIRFEFPARKTAVPAAHPSFLPPARHAGASEPVTFTWYDGGQPDARRTATAMISATSRRMNC